MVDRVRALVRAIREGDDARVEDAVLHLSQSRRWLAPLAFVVGAFVMLFDGLRPVFSSRGDHGDLRGRVLLERGVRIRDRGTGSAADPPGFARARVHRRVVLASGAVVGVCPGLSTIAVTRWGKPWFTLSLSVVIGVMMIRYVGVPSRLIGITPTHSRRDKLAASAVSGARGAAVCTPPYVLGRVGILMLGSHALLIPGIWGSRWRPAQPARSKRSK